MDCSLILASGSRYKRRLLKRLGLDFRSDSADIEEAADPGESPAATARRLAALKASTVAERHPDAWVLGADQVVTVDGLRLSKPGSLEAAVDQLKNLSGRSHQLVNAIALVTPSGDILEDEIVFEMVMRELTEADIRAYVEEDTPLDCAGAYKIESAGIRLFRALRGDDYTAIIGLPLTRVWNILETAGYFTRDANPPSLD